MIKRVVAAVVLMIASGVGWEVTRSLSPVVGLAWAVGIGTLFLWWHVRPGPSLTQRLALARIARPIGDPKWAWLSVAATIAVIFGISGFIESWGPAWPESEWMAATLSEFADLQSTPIGWIAVAVWMIGVAPLIGEFSFRGYIQGALEQRWSPLWAILAVPAFTTVPLLIATPVPWAVALLLGLTSAGAGFVAYHFQSIWPAVGVTAGSAFLYFTLPLVHGDLISNFGGLAPTYLIPLSIGLTSAGGVGWYLVLTHTKGPGSDQSDAAVARAGHESAPGLRAP